MSIIESIVKEEDEDFECTEAEIQEAKLTPLNQLPQKSRKLYLATYKTFMQWRIQKNEESFSESVLLTYFNQLSEKFKSSSLWRTYSMLRSTLDFHHNIKIDKYIKLRKFLKQKSQGFHPKKAKTFSAIEVRRFLADAPNDKYLATKVALVIGILGECKASEMYAMKVKDFEEQRNAYLVTIPTTASRTVRRFIVTDEYYELCKKYMEIRAQNITSDIFFYNFQYGKCMSKRIGINKFTSMGRDIALFLKLADSEKYSALSFRKTSASMLLLDTDGDNLTTVKTTHIDKKHVDNVLEIKAEPGTEPSKCIHINQDEDPLQTNDTAENNVKFKKVNIDCNSTMPLPSIYVSNCKNTHIVINIYK
ncbi:uncharacterized protein [Euwallacea fornicatus]|uniref:uncharacterized protein n=1 Tax=Euwallacea fornicatus TaxID=995702 RepID=UPI00338D68AB